MDTEVKIEIGSGNFRYYNEMGYKCDKDDIILVKIKDLPKGSHVYVRAKCDYCGDELLVMYKQFVISTSVVKKCSCSKQECVNEKIGDVCEAKFGPGIRNPFQAEAVKEKSKQTLYDRTGVYHPMHLQETKDKIDATCIRLYGCKSYTQTEEYLEKTIETSLKNWGFPHCSQSEEFQERNKATRIKNGTQLPDELIEPSKLYRREVDNILDRNWKLILENWDGYDYYDGEYIKDNFNLEILLDYFNIQMILKHIDLFLIYE